MPTRYQRARRHLLHEALDPYQTLGLSAGASEAEIKQAFRRIALQNHPDRHPGNAEAEARFKAAGAAYEYLTKPQKNNRREFGGGAGRSGTHSADDAFWDSMNKAYQQHNQQQAEHEREDRPRHWNNVTYPTKTAWLEGGYQTMLKRMLVPVHEAENKLAGWAQELQKLNAQPSAATAAAARKRMLNTYERTKAVLAQLVRLPLETTFAYSQVRDQIKLEILMQPPGGDAMPFTVYERATQEAIERYKRLGKLVQQLQQQYS